MTTRSRRVNMNLDMQQLSTVMNLPHATYDSDATPLSHVREMVAEVKPDGTDYLAAYILSKA